MPRAIVFDVDGTLVDSVGQHADSWAKTLEEFGHPCDPARVRLQIGKGGDQLMKEFLSEEEIARDGESIEAARKSRFERDGLPQVKGFPKVPELFRRILADGKTVVLASSASSEELRTYKEIAGISDLVEDETSKDDVEKSKPYPDIFEAVLSKLKGLQPAEALVVGDSPWDAISASKAGMKTVGLLSGGFAEEDLREAGCVAIYEDPEDLLANYDSSPLAPSQAGG